MKSLIAALVLLPVAAWGQDPTATDERAVPHNCIAFYPPAEAQAGIEGTTTLRFVITEKGRVRDIEVDKSSGNSNLDEAARSCTKNWKYNPATKDGKPVAVPWRADIVWKTQAAPLPAFAEPPRDCVKTVPVQASELKGISGVSEYEYVIAKGRVQKVLVIKSSGSKVLDRAGSDCIATRKYVREMVMVDGKEQDRVLTTTLREKINWADALKPKS